MIDKATGVALGIKIKCSNNIKSLKSLLRYLSGEIDLKKVGLGRPNTKLRP